MYKPNVTLTPDVMNYIEGSDIYNSQFINDALKLTPKTLTVENKKLDRLDLLTSLFYSSNNQYAGLLGLINGFDFINFDPTIKNVKYLSQSDISKLINRV